MIVYAESSAVVAWLFAEEGGNAVGAALESAEHVVASELVSVECARALIRASVIGRLTDREVATLRRLLDDTISHWESHHFSPEVLDRSQQPFPLEPIRALDALHLACALDARAALPTMAVLSLDARVRDNAARLGFDVIPSGP